MIVNRKITYNMKTEPYFLSSIGSYKYNNLGDILML